MTTRGQQTSTLVLEHKVPTWIGKRMRVDFWLFVDRARDCELIDIIAWFKSKGLFRSSVMTGLKVMYAYMHGDFDTVLAELPELKRLIGQGCEDANTELLKEILANQRKLLEQGITAPTLPAPPADYPTMKPLAGLKPIAAPVWDDEDELPALVTTKAATDAGQNFLRSMSGVH